MAQIDPTAFPAESAAGPAEGADIKPPWRRICLFALLVAVLLALVYFSPLKAYLVRARELSQTVRSLGLLGPMVLMLCVSILVAVGFPRLLFCVIAGMALGFWQGLFWTQLGTLLGNYILFLIARTGGGEWIQHLVSKRARLSDLLRNEGISGVILARQLPVPGLIINLGLGLLSLRHRDFLIGTIIGQLPAAIPCTLIGAGALTSSFRKSIGLCALAVALALILCIALRYFLRNQRPKL
jgi:uncharacterized membrane protein YdjX (TVP38/TMEM64 family)